MPRSVLRSGGPLRAVGSRVPLSDAASEHLGDAEIINRVAACDAEVALSAHVGSTSAHPCCVPVLPAVKAARPLTSLGGSPGAHQQTASEISLQSQDWRQS